LIGFGMECLFPPRTPAGDNPRKEKKKADGAKGNRDRNSGSKHYEKRNEKKPSSGNNRNKKRGKR
ncbi:MAG: hypothetical protein IJ252_14835, partial [Solobacterium sp.]|nr:hypothetical protein [Solobacterium sp.]